MPARFSLFAFLVIVGLLVPFRSLFREHHPAHGEN